MVPKPEWEATPPLTACGVTGDALTLGFRTNATRPRDRADSPRLGVAVRHVILQMGDQGGS